jgi:hypothetical protein
MPDDALFQAAEDGSLEDPAEVERQATRLSSDPRATSKLVSFHEQAWQFGKLSRVAPDADSYPDAPSNLGDAAAEAGRLFIGDVLESGGGFGELLTADFAYADPGLAVLYGEDVSEGFQRIELDPTERRGFLTQVGFLAANAHAIKTDPIHRGLFVGRNLLCLSIPDPDADFTQLGLPETDTPPQTTRDEVALLTGTNDDPDPMRLSTCGACHSIINPAGFAFESFDAVGQVRRLENGVAVDTTGELLIDGQMVAFASALDLIDDVASSSDGKACYASKLTSFALGHDTDPYDPELTAIALEAIGPNDLAKAIAMSVSFRSRLPNEVAP